MSHPIAPIDFARLHEQAHRRALELRRQAIRDGMDGLGRALQQAFTLVVRAGRRWPQRLSQAAASRPPVKC